jgi:hypothetical protein
MLLNITKAGRLDLALPSFRNCRLQIVSSNPSFLNNELSKDTAVRSCPLKEYFSLPKTGLIVYIGQLISLLDYDVRGVCIEIRVSDAMHSP